ncbi:MAG: hypothetical protein HFF48_08630, partial [Lawsonibacter sp.]|nr:hypothetical protein [Lawsonibacter sp.]
MASQGFGVRQTISAALLFTVVLFFLPALTVRSDPAGQSPEAGGLPNGEAVLPIERTPSAVSTGGRDKGRAVRLLTREGEVLDLTMAEYLWAAADCAGTREVTRSATSEVIINFSIIVPRRIP